MAILASRRMVGLDNRVSADPGTAAFQVAKYPFYLLNRLVGRYNEIIGRRLQQIGLDIPSWRVLMILGEISPRAVGDIASAAVIPLSTMTRIIQRMDAAGFVSSSPGTRDARVTEVSLTPLGRAKTAEARKAAAPVYRELISGVEEDEFEQLLELLERLYVNLDSGRI